ncbi:MAG: potassium channel protein [Pseudomonadota bacterium]
MPRGFDTSDTVLGSPTRNLIAIVIYVLVVVVLATIAYMAAGWSLIDASYMVLLTVYTVGYGEVRAIDTPYLHTVTIATMVFGCTGMILLTGALVQLFTLLQLKQIFGRDRMQSRIDKLTGHVVICGYGRIGNMLAREMTAGGKPLVVIERGEAKLAEAEAAGHLCLIGDATDENVLRSAGILRAHTLATVLPDDAANVFITLSARNLNRDLEIIARGETPATESKLLQAGANHVVLPAHIGAERIARMILYPASADMTDDATLTQARNQLDGLGLDLELVPAVEGATMCGLTIADAERLAAGAMFIVQINRGGERHSPRSGPDEKIEAGDEVLIVVRDSTRAAKTLFNTKSEMRVGRNRF